MKQKELEELERQQALISDAVAKAYLLCGGNNESPRVVTSKISESIIDGFHKAIYEEMRVYRDETDLVDSEGDYKEDVCFAADFLLKCLVRSLFDEV